MRLRTESQEDGRADFSSVQFPSQVIESTNLGVEHNSASPIEPTGIHELHQRRQISLSNESVKLSILRHRGRNVWN
jgi:hypothetical protein